MATGSMTPNPSRPTFPTPTPAQRIELAWEADGSGAVDREIYLSGLIVRVEFKPAAGGDAPDADYDVYLNDSVGIDLLEGAGEDLSATDPSHTVPSVGATGLPPTVAEPVTLMVANAGAGKRGTVVLYVRP